MYSAVAYSPQPNTQFGQPSKGWAIVADNNYLDSLVDSGKFTREEVDKAWAQAKQQANANKKKDPGIVMTYAYTTSLFNAILGVGKQPERATQLNAATRLKAMRT